MGTTGRVGAGVGVAVGTNGVGVLTTVGEGAIVVAGTVVAVGTRVGVDVAVGVEVAVGSGVAVGGLVSCVAVGSGCCVQANAMQHAVKTAEITTFRIGKLTVAGP